jgi:hypothetical protein
MKGETPSIGIYNPKCDIVERRTPTVIMRAPTRHIETSRFSTKGFT